MFRIKSKIYKTKQVIYGVWQYNVLDRFKVLLPEEMIINLTYRCNSRCTMCNIWQLKPKSEMGLADWKKAISDPIFGQLRDLTISGGEPMLHPEYIKIVELFLKKIPKLKSLGVITNGFLTDQVVEQVKETARLCQKRGVLFNVSVSLDGVGKMHEEVRRIPKAFEKTTTTLLKLQKLQKAYHFGLGSGSVLLKQNIGRIEEMENWYKKHNIDHSYQIVGFHESFVNNLERQKDVDYGNKEKKELWGMLKNFSTPKSLSDFRSYYWKDMEQMYTKGAARSTPCPFRVNQMVIDGLGDVYYCLSVLPIGNFQKEKRSILAIYQDPKNLKFRNNLSKTTCEHCNSGCNVNVAIASDMKRYLWFRLTGKLWKTNI